MQKETGEYGFGAWLEQSTFMATTEAVEPHDGIEAQASIRIEKCVL